MKHLYADEFVARFMFGDLMKVKHQLSSVKLFDLSDIAPYIKTPTSSFLLGYNLFVFISDGSFAQQVGTEEYMLQAPAVLICNYGNVSAIKHVDNETKGFCLLVKEEAMISILREQEILQIYNIFPKLDLPAEESVFLFQTLKLLQQEISSSTPYKELIEGMVKVLLLKVLKLSSSVSILDRKNEIAMSYKQLLHRNFKDEKQLSFYADKLGISINYLNRCVYSVFKKSSKDLLQEIIIKHSQFMLLESTKSVADISYELNFEDPSYFTRLFKKVVGVSPSEFRKSVLVR